MSQILIPPLPSHLVDQAQAMWQAWCETAQAAGLVLQLSDEQQQVLLYVWICSAFVVQSCQRRPALLVDLLQSGDLERHYHEGDYDARVAQALTTVTDEAGLMRALRQLRNREMVRIAWRDIAGMAELQETTGDLSALAQACIDGALGMLHGWQVEEFGVPCSHSGVPQTMVVLGMGKLGAHELNFSSDVDLIFAYPEAGETTGGRRSALSNEEYFRRLGQRLITVIDQMTEDGFVFRVDMRLRPFGESGPLAMPFDAIEDYYQLHGRGWERYAMIKARVIAGDRRAGETLMAILQPFIYRRYLDYSAFDSLRSMKQLVDQEVKRKGMEHNIKLGPGGIREVEFIGQAFQLIRGGREQALQARGILEVLAALKRLNCLPGYVVDQLSEAYVFLRHTEHRLQEYLDRQTHLLPTDESGRLRLALAMGFQAWSDFEQRLHRHCTKVQGCFDQVFEAPQTGPAEGDQSGVSAVWQGSVDDTQALKLLTEAGFVASGEVLALLQQLHAGHSIRAMGSQAEQRMGQLMGLLLGAVAEAGGETETLRRLLEVIEKIARRTAYVALLLENPMALSQLVKLCGASPWISRLLARHPILLDELLDPRLLYAPPGRDALEAELRQRLSRIAEDDLEQQMECLRLFKQTNVLRVAAADVMAAIPLMEVSDHLSWIAEVILDQAQRLAWCQLVTRHGTPVTTVEGQSVVQGFAIVAYGKLGGIELGYGSDLDLVFLHGEGAGSTDGAKAVDNAVFFARLAQRIIHLLTTHTPAGVLYEVDLRLRPSGSSGLLVSNTHAFALYQREDAWTWEHQALVRARVVAGDAAIAERFATIRRETLQRPRDATQLRREVCEMRERMRRELVKAETGLFDLKQGVGGIADIEFMVQYGVLAGAARHPQLCQYTDNIRLLALLAQTGLISEADAALLSDAYRRYRAAVHRLTLQELPALAPEAEYETSRQQVIRIWQQVMSGVD